MDTKYIVAFLVLLTSSFYEVASRPSEVDGYPPSDAQSYDQPVYIRDEIGRSAPPINIPEDQDNTKSILEKIGTVNEGLKRPHREQFNLDYLQNTNLQIDKELLAKIQDLIASGKINGFSDLQKHTVNNGLDEERTRVEYARTSPYTRGNQLVNSQPNAIYSGTARWWHIKPDPRRALFKISGPADAVEGTTEREFMIILKPIAHSITSSKGIAIANPVSNVIIGEDRSAAVVHQPLASAIAGPGGIAHAQSDLYVYEFIPNKRPSLVQYIPFYGGAKGQYLEIKKNNAGNVLSEKIVSEEKLSNDNIVKNNNENLLSKVLAANLQTLQTLSRSVFRLHNLGRKVGYLGESEKASFKTQLMSLGEAASNTIKLIDEVGEDIDVLFKSNVTKREYEEEDNVEEEGVGVDSPDVPEAILESAINIAEAKPIGLAVVGEGLAASRPVATAIAATGIAIAQPTATAIAGVDPGVLGLQLNIPHQGKH